MAAGYYRRKAETILNGYQTMQDTVMATYGSEIQPAMDAINESLNDSLNQIFENPNISNPEDYVKALDFAIENALNSVELSPDAKNAIGMLFEGMAPTEEQLRGLTAQIERAGGEVPEAIQKAMSNIGTVGAAAGEKEDLWTIIGNQVANSPERALLLETVQQQSGQIPQEAIKAVESMYPEAEAAARGFLESMRVQFAEGLDVTVPVNVQTITKSNRDKRHSANLRKAYTSPCRRGNF